MKVLDEKGRLFGKINLVDLIVILVVVAVVAAVGWKFLGNKITEVVTSTNPTIEYEVLCEKVFPGVAEFAETCVGDQLMASGKLLDGEIIYVENRPHHELTESGESVEDPSYRDAYFIIRCRATKTSNALSIGTQDLRVGKVHIVKSVQLEIPAGVILSMKEVETDE